MRIGRETRLKIIDSIMVLPAADSLGRMLAASGHAPLREPRLRGFRDDDEFIARVFVPTRRGIRGNSPEHRFRS
ncbi:MAG: hypothetical protein RLZZ232_665 [Planctomycetota bacterium]|jgi:hypothetical protein